MEGGLECPRLVAVGMVKVTVIVQGPGRRVSTRVVAVRSESWRWMEGMSGAVGTTQSSPFPSANRLGKGMPLAGSTAGEAHSLPLTPTGTAPATPEG